MGLGDHHGDGFARKGYAILREQGLRRVLRTYTVEADDGRQARHGARTERLDILLRKHADNACSDACSFDIKGAKPRVGMRTSDETGESLVRKMQIVRILTVPRHEAHVFRTAHGLPYAETHLVSRLLAKRESDLS
jgi:hypothetical protein